MEQLAERRMQREDWATADVEEDSEEEDDEEGDEDDEDEDSEWLSRAASTSCSESLRGRGSWVVGSKTVQKGAMIDLLCAGKSDGNTCSGEPETQAAV